MTSLRPGRKQNSIPPSMKPCQDPARNSLRLVLTDPLSGDELSSSFRIPRDPAKPAWETHARDDCEISACIDKMDDKRIESVSACCFSTSKGSVGALFTGTDQLGLELPGLLFQGFAPAIARLPNKHNGREAEMILNEGIEGVVSDGFWPFPDGTLKVSIAFLRPNGSYSVASIGDHAAYDIIGTSVRCVAFCDMFAFGEKEIRANEMDIDDFKASRKATFRFIDSTGLNESYIISASGVLQSGGTLVLASAGFVRNLCVEYDPGTEAVINPRGEDDLSAILVQGAASQSADAGHGVIALDKMLARFLKEVKSRMQRANDPVESDMRHDRWAILPDLCDVALIAMRKP